MVSTSVLWVWRTSSLEAISFEENPMAKNMAGYHGDLPCLTPLRMRLAIKSHCNLAQPSDTNSTLPQTFATPSAKDSSGKVRANACKVQRRTAR